VTEFATMSPRGNTMRLRLPILVVVAVLWVSAISAVTADNSTDDADQHVCTRKADECQPGIVLPIWQPNDNISWMDRAARAVVYLLALVYLFLGVSIISDRFMSSIEVITSSEREVTVYRSVAYTEMTELSQIVLAAAGATSTMAQATSTGLGLVLGLGFVDIMWTSLLQIVDVSGCSQQ